MAQIRIKPVGLILLFLILSIISFGLGFGLWSLTGKVNIAPTESSAAGCSAAESPKECGGCGGAKGDGSRYECVWRDGGCGESGNRCDGGGGGGETGCNNSQGTVCKLGSKPTCQTNNNGNTGYLCNCIDVTNAGDSCTTAYQCNTFDPQGCKPESGNGQPTYTNVPIVNGCATLSGASGYNLYYCPDMPQNNNSQGCQQNGSQVNGSSVCSNSFPSSHCGWVQADFIGVDGVRYASWYIPCNEENPETPETPGVNVCNGGGVKTPTNSADYEVGEVVVFSGYAYDTDGINKSKIVVKVDGVVVGNATATDKLCPAGSTDAACVAAAGKPVVDWTYSYTVTTAGAHTFAATWEDTKGITGSSCQGSRVITSNIQGNPDWEISKTGASICIDKTAGAQKAQVDYTITIKNVGDLAGQLSTLVDTQDAKVKSSFIQQNTVVPDADVSGRTLTWDVSGALGLFTPGQSKTFKYSMVVPQSSFGTYINTVTGTPDSGDAIQTTEVTIVGCDAPQTGLFDSTASKVVLGIILIAGSAIYLYSEGKIFSDLDISGRLKKKRKEDFENRVAGA